MLLDTCNGWFPKLSPCLTLSFQATKTKRNYVGIEIFCFVSFKYKKKIIQVHPMETNFSLEINSKIHLSLGELGNIMDIFHWKFCKDTMVLFTLMFLFLSCIIKSEAKILCFNSVKTFPWKAKIMWLQI